MEAVSLVDEISQSTERKGAGRLPQDVFEQDPIVRNPDDFQREPARAVTDTFAPAAVDPEEAEEKATPEESAMATIDMIDLAQKSIFALLITRKQKRKYPAAVMQQFIEVDIKDMLGEELTPAEARQLARYREFEKRLNTMIGNVSFTDTERNDLMASTTAFCEKHGISIPAGVWFGVRILETITKRIFTLLEA